MKIRPIIIKTKIEVTNKNSLKRLLALKERVNGTGYFVGKLVDDLMVIQKRLADILTEIEDIIEEEKE